MTAAGTAMVAHARRRLGIRVTGPVCGAEQGTAVCVRHPHEPGSGHVFAGVAALDRHDATENSGAEQ